MRRRIERGDLQAERLEGIDVGLSARSSGSCGAERGLTLWELGRIGDLRYCRGSSKEDWDERGVE